MRVQWFTSRVVEVSIFDSGVSLLRNWLPLLAMLAVSMNCGCRKGLSPEQAKQRLVGRYALGVGHDCATVRSSTLLLRLDGTYDQHIQFTSGEVMDEVGQPWSYDGGVHFSNFRITSTGELQRYAPETEASLLVQFGHPVVILLSPSSDCFYSQPK